MEAAMRKYLGFGATVAFVALGIIIWAKSGVVATTNGVAQSRSAIVPYEMMLNAKDLPVQRITDFY
jgi:hypothetical protein